PSLHSRYWMPSRTRRHCWHWQPVGPHWVTIPPSTCEFWKTSSSLPLLRLGIWEYPAVVGVKAHSWVAWVAGSHWTACTPSAVCALGISSSLPLFLFVMWK